jgi:hypothetical protein
VRETDLAALDATLDEAHENAVEDAVPDDLYASGVTLAETRALVAALRAARRERDEWEKRAEAQEAHAGDCFRAWQTAMAERDATKASESGLIRELSQRAVDARRDRQELYERLWAVEAERDRYRAFVERVESVARSDARGWSDSTRIAEEARAVLAAPGAGGEAAL